MLIRHLLRHCWPVLDNVGGIWLDSLEYLRCLWWRHRLSAPKMAALSKQTSRHIALAFLATWQWRHLHFPHHIPQSANCTQPFQILYRSSHMAARLWLVDYQPERLSLAHRAASIGTSDLYRIIGSYANQSADIADPVEPIERSSSLSGNLVAERFI